jgi:hypothetical protein
VIAIVGILASVVLSSLNSVRTKARDAKRIADIRNIQSALELYYDQYGQYPYSDEMGTGGWDTPGNGTFIQPLVNAGFIGNIKDPLWNDFNGNYLYYRYWPGIVWTGCEQKYYYVLAIRNFEQKNVQSPGWSCSLSNWQDNFPNGYVVGKYES